MHSIRIGLNCEFSFVPNHDVAENIAFLFRFLRFTIVIKALDEIVFNKP